MEIVSFTKFRESTGNVLPCYLKLWGSLCFNSTVCILWDSWKINSPISDGVSSFPSTSSNTARLEAFNRCYGHLRGVFLYRSDSWSQFSAYFGQMSHPPLWSWSLLCNLCIRIGFLAQLKVHCMQITTTRLVGSSSSVFRARFLSVRLIRRAILFRISV